jgi:hypothetical protein
MAVARFLSSAGFPVDVTSNVSMQNGKPEWGCRVVQSLETKEEVDAVWKLLRDEYNLGCAHLHVAGKFDGCVLDYIAPSRCLAED